MKQTARAGVLERFNEPVAIKAFDVPDPEPGALVVKVRFAGVCGTDVHLYHGRLPLPLPVLLGHETVGVIAKLGQGVQQDFLGNQVREGDLIAWAPGISCGRCDFCVIERERTLCRNRRVYGYLNAETWPYLMGGWSEYVYLVPQVVFFKVPSGVEDKDVIALGCAGPTAVHAALYRAGIGPMDTVLVQGSGPVGVAAAMFARLRGARKVIIVGGPKERLDLCQRLGIGDVHIDIFTVTDPAKRAEMVLEETEGRGGVDVGIEATGVSEAVPQGIGVMRRNGRYVILGHYTDHGPTLLNPHEINKRHLNIFGCWGIGEVHYLRYLQSLPLLKGWYNLKALITYYSLEEVNQALLDVEAGRIMKGVLRMA